MRRTIAVLAMLTFTSIVAALEPPTREQLERYRRDGSLAGRVAAARKLGNHQVAPHLVRRLAGSFGRSIKAAAEERTSALPSTGTTRIFALLIAFSDYAPDNSVEQIDSQLFGSGVAAYFPYDSLRGFYQRSSYGQLDFQGSTLGWYTTPYSRSQVAETEFGREGLIWEAINHFDSRGHDFARYDNDGDGRIDYFIVIWTGPRDEEWASFWWGYKTGFSDQVHVVDDKVLASYSWQPEAWDYPGPFYPKTVIHETGHALGLPDYYDYDDTVGPPGGVGRLDIMGGSADHCAFSKFLLGWLAPQVFNEATHTVSLSSFSVNPDAALVMHGDPPVGPFGEFFLVENRLQRLNDIGNPGEGLLIWHVDARLDDTGSFLYDNSFTEHKLLRLMEADGLEQIEQGLNADASDYYVPGGRFAPDAVPASNRYDGAPTNIVIDSISQVRNPMSFQADLGSGCAIYCEADVPGTVWLGSSVLLDASATTLANCPGPADFGWNLADEGTASEVSFEHVFSSRGTFDWNLETDVGDASCARQGSIEVCTDDRCWGWSDGPPMGAGQAEHSALLLDDGRVLAAGGSATPEIFDPVTETWSPTGPLQGTYHAAGTFLLNDGRVLIAGNTYGGGVNAELYDPASGNWTVTGQLATARYGAATEQLADGRVLVVGGLSVDDQGLERWLLDAEIYDPATGSWSPAGTIDEGMYRPGLTALDDGRALLTGYGQEEIFDPAALTWSPLSDSGQSRYPWRGHHLSLRLQDGRVLIAGGYYTALAEIFDPATGNWTHVGAMDGGRVGATATVLPSGRVLVCGGAEWAWFSLGAASTTGGALVFDPDTASWYRADPMEEPRYAHAAVLLDDGTVLVVGGLQAGATAASSSMERYSSPSPFTTPREPLGRVGH